MSIEDNMNTFNEILPNNHNDKEFDIKSTAASLAKRIITQINDKGVCLLSVDPSTEKAVYFLDCGEQQSPVASVLFINNRLLVLTTLPSVKLLATSLVKCDTIRLEYLEHIPERLQKGSLKRKCDNNVPVKLSIELEGQYQLNQDSTFGCNQFTLNRNATFLAPKLQINADKIALFGNITVPHLDCSSVLLFILLAMLPAKYSRAIILPPWLFRSPSWVLR